MIWCLSGSQTNALDMKELVSWSTYERSTIINNIKTIMESLVTLLNYVHVEKEEVISYLDYTCYDCWDCCCKHSSLLFLPLLCLLWLLRMFLKLCLLLLCAGPPHQSLISRRYEATAIGFLPDLRAVAVGPELGEFHLLWRSPKHTARRRLH